MPLHYRGGRPWVAIYTRPSDAAEVVGLVRSRLLEASAVALLIALACGFFVARALALRVSRLERAARDLAAGRQVRPLPVDSTDELGRLTQAFNEMQEQLARVDRARKEFIANASHELRTPIFSLGGFVELLQDEQLDQATRDEFLETMGEQVARLQKLAVDLLDLSRLDAGRWSWTRRWWTSASSRARWRRSSRRRSLSTGPTSICASRTRRLPPAATVNGWPRSCVSCSTTPSGTPRRAPR